MKKALAFAILLFILLIPTSAEALNSKEFTYGDTSVYGIDGYGVNLTLTVGQPIVIANSTTISFTLNILEPFSARGIIVNQSDYFVNRKTLDFYLLSGVLLDYDRGIIIDALWVNWGDSLNATHVQEEKMLYSGINWVNFTKSGNSYFGAAILPQLSEGLHNATIWVRAEQDQVTTYIPYWAAFSKTVTFTIQVDTPTRSPTTNPTLLPTVNTGPHVNDDVSSLLYILGIVVVLIAATVSLLVYFEKHNKRSNLAKQSFLQAIF